MGSVATTHKTTTQKAELNGDALEPRTLGELLRLQPNLLHRVDVARMNLLSATGLPGTESFDLDTHLKTLDHWTNRVRMRTPRLRHLFDKHRRRFENSEPLWRMYCLTRVLERDYGIHYCPEERDMNKDADWRKCERHLIHGLLGPERHGTCPSFPALIVAVGRRLGYPLRLVHSPSHVFSRWDGLDSPDLSWRTRFNVECHGHGLNTRSDESYYDFPVTWASELRELERKRGPRRLFLRSLAAHEELASFLVQRAHCFEAHNRFDDAWATYARAYELSDANPVYRFYATDVHAKKLELCLHPYRLTPLQFAEMVEQKLRGAPVILPWEHAATTAVPVHAMAPVLFLNRDGPPPIYDAPLVSIIGDPMIATEKAIASRLGIPWPSGVRSPAGVTYPKYMTPSDVFHEQCVYTGEYFQGLGRTGGVHRLQLRPFNQITTQPNDKEPSHV